MELHRRGVSVVSVILLILGIAVLAFGRPDSAKGVVALVVAPFAVALGLWTIYRRVRPYRFHIGPDGLTLRTKGINRLVGWSEIYCVVLTGDTLLLVPAVSGFEAKLDQASPLDAKPALQILSFQEVKETPSEVAEALSRFGGERFVDARSVAVQTVSPDFTVALRGYDFATVDALIARAEAALADDSGPNRTEVKAELEAELAKGLPIALRGYDRQQVDTALGQLLERLGR